MYYQSDLLNSGSPDLLGLAVTSGHRPERPVRRQSFQTTREFMRDGPNLIRD